MNDRFILGRATGLSMWPTLRPGDTIIVDCTTRRVEVGDVLVFNDVVHRVIWVDPFERIWEQGDSESSQPRRRSKDEIRGHVSTIVRDGEFITLAPRRPSLTAYIKLAAVIASRVLPATREAYKQKLPE